MFYVTVIYSVTDWYKLQKIRGTAETRQKYKNHDTY